jgi:murein DD-endopeptidase MepM/ murein hydrolase activator NlpD
LNSGRLQGLGVLGLAVFCLGVLGPAAPLLSPSASAAFTVWQQVDHRCKRYAREQLAPYPWPLIPFNKQHPVRGYFGDPRTVFSSPGEGAFSFHNGIDISAWPGNHVFPVVSGVVAKVSGDRVIVRADDSRRFQYLHIAPSVQAGERVIASQTMLGTVHGTWNHVHLSELRGNCAVNPLARGHLTPYRDTTRPTVEAILFQTASRRPLSPKNLTGKVRIVADAYDTPALPNPYPWAKVPVAPAKITWRLTTAAGRVVAKNTSVDFRFGEPPRQDFCAVYAPATEQNFAAVDGTFHWGKPGRYLYDLTPHLIDTTRLPPGSYRVTVKAADTRGNKGVRTQVVEIRHTDKGASSVAAPDARCTSPTAAATQLSASRP